MNCKIYMFLQPFLSCSTPVSVVYPAMADSKLVCLHCALEFDVVDGRQHGRHFRCKNCESATRQIRRNLDSCDLENFTPEEQRDFFRKLAEEKQTAGNGRVPWSTIRASLLTAMTNRTVNGYRSDVQGKKLPLEVWMSKGWKEETIRRMPSEFSEEYGCDVYQVKVQQETWFEANEKMRERMVQQEQQATKKKGGKANAGDNSLNDLDLPAAAAPDSNKSQKKEAKTQAAALKKLQAENLRISTRAAKAVGPLQSNCTSLGRLCVRAEKCQEHVPPAVRETAQTVLTKLESWAKDARACMNKDESQKSLPEGSELQALALAFSPEDLKTTLKQCAEVSKSVRNHLPQKVAKAKAAPKETGDTEPKRRRVTGKKGE